jgi:hypothetical protein
MAQVVTARAEPPTIHNEHHDLPPFATPMLVLFGTYVAWLLVVVIVLYLIA